MSATTNPDKRPAQIAYEAYCNFTGWKSLATGQNLPRWPDLSEPIKEAWSSAANAVASAAYDIGRHDTEAEFAQARAVAEAADDDDPDATSEHYRRVREFMKKAGQECLVIPTVPDAETRILRAKLILEEALETARALGICVSLREGLGSIVIENQYLLFDAQFEPDLIEIADGCADISVVTTGTLIACGITDVALLRLIDESNLAKFERTCPECGADDSEGGFADAGSRPRFRCRSCGQRYEPGYRREDGKWVKPAYWKVPNIPKLLVMQGWNPYDSYKSEAGS